MEKKTRNASYRTTIKDIAAALNISHATVSRALNNSPLISKATRDRVHRAAKQMGYFPDSIARMMRGSSANIVGFILPDVQNHFYSTVAKIIAETIARAGLQLVLAISEEDPRVEMRHVAELRQARVRGIIITPTAKLYKKTAGMLDQVQTIQLVRRHRFVDADVVVADDRRAVYLSTQHLARLGHTRIAYIGGGTETLSTGEDRLNGYHDAMREAGIDSCATATLGPPRPEFGYQAASEVLRARKPPTGIVLGSSQLTLGTLRAIRDAGLRIPQDISLIGYDDPDWFEYWQYGITTIALPIEAIAVYAASRICGHEAAVPEPAFEADADQTARKIIFPVRLIERGTTAAPSVD